MEDDSQFIKKVLSPTPGNIKATQQLRNVQQSMKELVIVFDQFRKKMTEFAENAPKNSITLAENGWFWELDGDLRIPPTLSSKIKKGFIDEVDAYLMHYYTSNMERIIEIMKQRHLARQNILEEIHTAHKHQLFFVAIPCILTQVDGLCDDFAGEKFFMKDKEYLPKVRCEIERNSNMVLNLFLSPFQCQTPIIAHEDFIKDYPCTLNRHRIMHGVDTTYGSQLNSLKCISLLKYVSDVITEISKPRDRKK